MANMGKDDKDIRSDAREEAGGKLVTGVEDVSAQERRSWRDRTEEEEIVLQEFKNLLITVKQTPKLWGVARMWYLREFCSFVERNPKFQFQHEDNTIDMILPIKDHELHLT
jgi:hypothetical protein